MGELFFLLYTPFWLTLVLGIVVPYKLYEVDSSKNWKDRYWVKSSLWIIIFSYFFTVLGASYTFPSWKMMNVRHMTFLLTQFPYYQFVDQASMYTVGSLFYASYFFVSFQRF